MPHTFPLGRWRAQVAGLPRLVDPERVHGLLEAAEAARGAAGAVRRKPTDDAALPAWTPTLDPGHDATMDSKVKSNAEIRRGGMGLRVPHRTHTVRLPGLVAVSFTARPGETKYRFNAIKGRRL